MSKLEIELSPEEERALREEAQKRGLSFVEFARQRLLSSPSALNPDLLTAWKYDPTARPIWEVAAELGAQIPPEERAKVPRDLSINHDHYLYGSPKVEE